MLFLCVCLVVFQEILSQNYVIDREFNVGMRREDEIMCDIFLDFACPEGFLRDDNRCLLNETLPGKCPSLKSTVSYQLKAYKMGEKRPSKADDPNLRCSYSIQEFLRLPTEGNSGQLELFLDGTNKPYKLYLDVTTDKPVDDLGNKISCLSKANRRQIQNVDIREQEGASPENGTTKRFLLPLNKKLEMFYCYIFIPGQVKPTGSNVIFANKQTKGTFVVRLVDVNPIETLRDPNLNQIGNATDTYIVAVENVDAFTTRESLKQLTVKGAKVVDVASTSFCPEETSNATQSFWPKTPVGEVAFPKKRLCLNNEGEVIKRRCQGDYLTGARWSEEAGCSDKPLRNITQYLIDLQDETVTTPLLEKLSEMMGDEEFGEVDVNLVTNILTRIEAEIAEESFFSVIDKIDEFVELNTLDGAIKKRVVKSIDEYIRGLPENFNGSSKNIQYTSSKPFQENFTTYELGNIQVELTKEFLQELKLSPAGKKGFSITLTVFGNAKFFPKNEEIKSKIIDVKFGGTTKGDNAFKESILIRFPSVHPDLKCHFWDERTAKWSTLGVDTFPANDTVECRSYHLTKFALLIVSSDIVIERGYNDKEELLNLISRVELIVSLAGVFIILFLATTSPEWRKKRFYIVQLSMVIFFECILVLMLDVGEKYLDSSYCLYIGSCLHFIVLKKFLLMFLIGVSQMENFVKIFKKTKKIITNLCCQGTLLRWIIPFLIALVSAACYPEKYAVTGSLRFCYPQEKPHTFFVVIPVSLVLSFNAAVFALVFARVARSQSKLARGKLFQFKLGVMLWFLLGGTWLAGILVNILPRGIFQEVCHYVLVLVAPLQGFAVFMFYVILDRSTRLSWKISFWSTS